MFTFIFISIAALVITGFYVHSVQSKRRIGGLTRLEAAKRTYQRLHEIGG